MFISYIFCPEIIVLHLRPQHAKWVLPFLLCQQQSAQATVDENERIFTEMIRSMEKKRSEVKEQIRTQEKAAVQRVEEVLKLLAKEILELKNQNAEMDKLSHTEDNIEFLQVTLTHLCFLVVRFLLSFQSAHVLLMKNVCLSLP